MHNFDHGMTHFVPLAMTKWTIGEFHKVYLILVARSLGMKRMGNSAFPNLLICRKQ